MKHSSIAALAAHAVAGVLGGRPADDAAGRLSEVCDHLPLALVDPDGVILEWTRGAEELYGWSRSEAVGRNKRVLLKSTENPVTMAWPPLGGRGMFVLTEQHRDGALLHVIETKIAIGTTCYLLSMAPTELKTVPAPVRLPVSVTGGHERSAMVAVTPARNAITAFEIDRSTGIISWRNDPWQIFGAPTGSMPITDLRSRFDPRDAEQMARDVDAAAARGDVALQWNTRIATMEPVQRAIDVAVQLFYEGGRLTRIVGVMLDLTEQRQREHELSVGRAELQSILDTVPDGMIVADAQGVVRGMSRAAAVLLGYDSDPPMMLTVQMILPQRWSAIRRHAGAKHTYDTSALRADGVRIPIELRAGEAIYEGGVAYTLFIADISDRMASHQRRDALLNRQAHDSKVSALGEFAAQLSHEINQPFTALGNYLTVAQNMLSRDVETGRLEAVLTNAREEARRAADILQRMQQLVAHRDVAMQRTDVAAIIHEAIGLLPAVGWPGVEVRYDIRPDASQVQVDPVQIQQVFANLLRNSVQAPARDPGERRTVYIDVRPRGDMVAISVRDNGVGIDPQILPNLFDPFTSTKGEDGMGLGLSICRTIIEAHGGTMTASNAATGGAIVTFTVAQAEREDR